MSAIVLSVQRLASRFWLRSVLLGAVILSSTSLASADVLGGSAGNALPLQDGGPAGARSSFTPDVRDLNFPVQATHVGPLSLSDAQRSADLQAGTDVTPYLIETFLGDQPFDAFVGVAEPSYDGFYDDSLNAIQVKSMGTGTGPSFLIDNIEMTTLGSTVPEPNTLLLLSSAMLVLGVGLRCLFARD
jgi:hypothetical protein